MFDGAASGNLYDDSGSLMGQAAWRWVSGSEADSPSSEDAQNLSPAVIAAAIGIAAGVVSGVVVATVVVVKNAPAIKRWWGERAFPATKSTWNRITKAREAGSQSGTAEIATLGIAAPADFSKEVDAALEDPVTSMSSAEAQKRLLALLMAAAFIADQMRRLSNARIDHDAVLELKSAMEKLTAQRVTDSINRMLETNTSLLDEKTSTEFMQIFEGGRVVDGQYAPLRSEKIKDALRLTDG